MCSVSSDQHAWQRSQRAGLLYFCPFAVLLLAMLCCCQPGALGLAFWCVFREATVFAEKQSESLGRTWWGVAFLLAGLLACKSPSWTRRRWISCSSHWVIFRAGVKRYPAWPREQHRCAHTAWVAQQAPGEDPPSSASRAGRQGNGTVPRCCCGGGVVSPTNDSKSI